MRMGAYIAVTLSLCVVGCKGADTAAPTAETDSGGETPAAGGSDTATPVGPGEAGEDAAKSVAKSPWGATKAEQCRRPTRPAMSPKARKSFDRGLRALKRNDLSEAEAEFKDALKKDGGAYAALYNLGVLADREGDESGALGYYQRSLAVLADYEPAARGIVAVALRRSNPQRAVAVVEPIARDYRTNLEMQALYAEVLVESKRYEEAWMAARRALKCDERFVPALIALVKASRAQGRDELAESILSQALEVDPDVAELHYLLGEQLEDEPGKLREVLRTYERAVALRPDYAEARMALGVQLLAGGNYQDAASHFEVAKGLVPTLPAVHVNLGDAYRALERWTAAQQSYRRALELQSKLPEAHFGLGLLYLTAGGDFPGLEEIPAFQKSANEFKTYRSQMGPRLKRDDPSEEYLRDLDRMIQRARRRIERDKERAAREAERGPREDATP